MSRIQPSLIVILFSLIGMLISSFSYWFAIRSIQFPEGSEVAGYLTHVDHIVERRTAKKLLWVELANGDNVYDGDTVRASDFSGADFVLPRLGLEIHLESSAILNLDMSKKKVVLDVLTGNIRFKGDFLEKTEVHIGSEVLKLDKGLIDLQVVKTNSSAAVSVIKGNVSDSQGKIKEQTAKDLASGQMLLQVESPLNGSRLRNSQVQFKWLGTAKLEVSQDPFFAQGQVFDFARETRSLDLKPGRWYWRVSSDSSKSLVQSIVIEPLLAPKISLPSKAFSGKETKGVWVAQNSTNSFLTWSKSEDFSVDTQSIPLTSAQFVITFNSPGIYYVQSVAKEGDIESKSSVSTILVEAPRLPIQPEILNGFGEKSQMEWQGGGSTLDWKGDGKRYDILFNGEELHSVIPHLSLAQLNLTPGNYEWKVRGINEDGTGNWSESKILSIYEPTDIVFNSNSFEVGQEKSILLSWTKSQYPSSRSRLRLFLDQEMKHSFFDVLVDREETEVPSKVLPIPSLEGPSSFFAMVQNLSEKGIVTGQSALTSIVISYYPEVKIPALSSPILAQKNGSFRLEWLPTSGEVNRMALLKCGEAHSSIQVTGNYFEFFDLLPGTCDLELRATSRGGKPKSSFTKVIVPAVSDLKKIKGIKPK